MWNHLDTHSFKAESDFVRQEYILQNEEYPIMPAYFNCILIWEMTCFEVLLLLLLHSIVFALVT